MRIGAVLGCASVLVAGQAFAQALPPSAEPGRVEQRFDSEARPQSKPDIELPAPDAAPPPEEADKVTFQLSGVRIDGATTYPEGAFLPLYEPLLGKPVTLGQIYQLRDAITAQLRADGHALSQAVIPAQRIQGGLITIQVIEGFINSVVFEGEVPPDDWGLLPVYADKIKASRPLMLDVLERYVLLINELPGVSARTVLKPAEGVTGGTDLAIVFERKRFSGSVTLDNRGTAEVGPYQINLAGSASDLTGYFEQTSLRYITTPRMAELKLVDAQIAAPITSEGTVLTVGARRNWSFPGGSTNTLGLRSLSTTLRATVSHPFIRSRAETLRGEAGLQIRDSRTDARRREVTEDRLRIVSLGLSYDFADGWGGSTLISGTLSQGLPVLGATESDSRTQSRRGGRADFTKFAFSAQRIQPVDDEVSVVVAAEGQWTPDRLLSAEEFGVGGSSYGRAFDPSEITGDKGAAARLELQYTPPSVDEEWFAYHQFYGFADYGAVWNYEGGPTQGWRDLASTGLGLRLGLLDNFSASFELAKPVNRRPAAKDDRDWRGFFSISARF